MSYFAAALARTKQGWTGHEFDLTGLEDLEAVTEHLRDLEAEGPVLLLLDQDDEWLGVVRVDGDADPRVFLSDRRAIAGSEVAALLWELEEEPVDDDDDDDDEGTRPIGEPVGDAALLGDLGTSAEVLLDLCAEEGLLPADVLSVVGERAGFGDVLDALREA